MPYVDATGAKLYFEAHGNGYPIIFAHEFGYDIRQWETQVSYFSRAYRCVTYNARGYPPSDVRRMPPCMAGSSPSTTSPQLCAISPSKAPIWWARVRSA